MADLRVLRARHPGVYRLPRWEFLEADVAASARSQGDKAGGYDMAALRSQIQDLERYGRVYRQRIHDRMFSLDALAPRRAMRAGQHWARMAHSRSLLEKSISKQSMHNQ